MGERRCRVCGCTQNQACVTDAGPCHWVAPDLCSGCAAEQFEAMHGSVPIVGRVPSQDDFDGYGYEEEDYGN